MKNKNALKYALLITMLVFWLVAFIMFYAASGAEERGFLKIPAIVLICLGALIFIYLISGVIISEVKNSKIRNAYRSIPLHDLNDYKAELDEIRSNFAADTAPDKNHILSKYQSAGTADWAKPYYDNNVVKVGEIYFGALVQANSNLFKKTRANPVLPGVIVYSTDDYYESNPTELKAIADKLFGDKANNDLRFERKFFTAKLLPQELTDGRKVYITSIMIARKLLPQYRLCGENTLVPVIAAPEKSTSVFIVDCKYWTDNIVAHFINESL